MTTNTTTTNTRLPRRLVTATAVAVLLAVPLAAPAAADDDDTATIPTTITITGGPLQITVHNQPRSLGTRPSSNHSATVDGELGQVIVTDRRGAPPGSGWVATVTANPYTTTDGPQIPASRVSYTTGPITRHGHATYTPNNPQNLKHTTAAVTATNITGNNTATWTPTLHINIPPNQPAGTYTATITHSVT